MVRVEGVLDLDGKVALVTGSGQNVGRQIALHLASHNAGGIVVNDFVGERAEQVAAEIRELGVPALPYQADVTDFDAVGAMFEAARAELGSVDVLVNNAGNRGAGPMPEEARAFWEMGPEDWMPWIDVNLHGVMNCTRHALPSMIDARNGRVITIISEAGRYGDAGLEAYAGAKAGAAGFTRSVARGTARYNVLANVVAIAAMRTPQIEQVLQHDDDRTHRMLRMYPLRRIGEPSDVANMVLFLASDASSWITGQTYPVNGGFTFAL